MASSQMRKGVLEGCVLALIARGETYGYELTTQLARLGFVDVAEGTLYPLLARLEKRGAIVSEARASRMGPRRKYVRITAAGKHELEAFREEFDQLSRAVALALGAESAMQAGGERPAVQSRVIGLLTEQGRTLDGRI